MSLRPCAGTPKRSWPTRQGGERRSPWSRVGVRSKAAVKTRLSWLSPYSPRCVEGEFSEVRVVMKAKEDPASCVRHENCLVSPEELIHLGPELGLIAFLGCVDVLVRRVRTLAAIEVFAS